MTQAEHISNRFSDAYLVALMASANTETILSKFNADYPELGERFAADAHDLEMMYGYMREAEKPTETEITSAYKNVSARIPIPVIRRGAESNTERVRAPFWATIRDAYKMRPMFAGASLGIGMAVILALLWQPWQMQNPKGTVADKIKSQEQTTGTTDYAQGTTPSVDNTNPSQIQPPTFRGTQSGQTLTAAEKRTQDSLDAIRMKSLATKNTLSAPSNVKLEAQTHGSVLVQWSASPNAFGYIVEMKRANEDKFAAVSQTTQTRFQMQNLHSGETITVRIVPTSGEHKGTASDAKSVIVP
jgi:hypothetical protein